MVSGFDKYFQIVRCFRDEDLRADRQPEFTQIDLEMSFPQQEQIFEVIEPLIAAGLRSGRDSTSQTPFPRLTYAEAMRSYGSDKPDLRMPPMYPVEDLFPGAALTRARPAAGGDPHSEDRRAEPQGARRAEGLRPGARPARVRRPQAPGARLSGSRWPQVRERTGAAEDDLLMLAGWAGEPKGQRPEETVLPGLRAIAPVRRAEV